MLDKIDRESWKKEDNSEEKLLAETFITQLLSFEWLKLIPLEKPFFSFLFIYRKSP